MSFSFNGITKSFVRALRGVERPTWAPIEHEIIEIPGRPGGYLTGKKLKVRVINVPIEVRGLNSGNLQILKEELAAWLITNEPKALTFPDEPNRTYFAEVAGELDLDEILWKGKGVITFICPDPYKYGDEDTGLFLNDALTINNNGTAETYPIFEGKVKEPITFLQIATLENYMMIGRQQMVEDISVDPMPTVLEDEMTSVTNWTSTGVVSVDGGIVTGTMASDGNKFFASGYGTGSDWHGPALRRNLPSPIQDFFVEVIFSLNAINPQEIGRVEVYLIGSDGKSIGKLAMKERAVNINDAAGEIRLGSFENGSMLFEGATGYRKGSYNNFYGRLFLQRSGQNYWGQIGEIVDGKPANRMNNRYTDSRNKFQTPLSAIQVHIGSFGTYPTVKEAAIHMVRIKEIKPIQTNEVPIIAQPDDVITIDNQTNNILINGESRTELKNFGASYFPLKVGVNELFVFPENSVELTAKWRKCYK